MLDPTSSLLTRDPFSHIFLDGPVETTELVLIRHGHAKPGPGAPDPIDPPLTDVGRLQADALAERLRHERFDAIYASPMRRALETAAPLAGRAGIGVQRHDGLREVGIQLAESSRDELAAWAASFNERLAKSGGRTGFRWDDLPLTEQSSPFRHRVLAAVDDIVEEHAGERVAIVCHAGVINACVAAALGLESDMFFLPLNASITVVRAIGERRVVHRMNDYEHLLKAARFATAVAG